MPKSADYWKKRMETIEDMSHSKGIAYAQNVDNQFRQAEKVLDDKITAWYQRISDNEEISLSAAKKLLNDDELEDFHLDVQEYIKRGDMVKYNPAWEKQLENASAKVHISRLEAMKLQMQQQCEELYGNMTDGLDAHLRDVYTDGYYHTAFEIQQGLNVGWGFNKLDDRKIEKVINSCWTNDGKTFKARCWTNKTKLVNELNTVLTQNIIRGEDPQKAINQLAHRMEVSKYNAGRLVMTETAAMSSMSQQDCFKELDVEEFEFVATLDSKTSEICRAMDGEHFKMSDFQIGVNAPPLHCFCRSCTVPYFADDVGQRAARDADGKTYYVSSDMKYKDWNKAFVQGDMSGLKDIKQKVEPITAKVEQAAPIPEVKKKTPKERYKELYLQEAELRAKAMGKEFNLEEATSYIDNKLKIEPGKFGFMSKKDLQKAITKSQDYIANYDDLIKKIANVRNVGEFDGVRLTTRADMVIDTDKFKEWSNGYYTKSTRMGREQADSFRDYSKGWDGAINFYERDGKIPTACKKPVEEVLQKSAKMSEYINSNVANENYMVYRGIKSDSFITGGKDIKDCIGQIYKEDGFTSTSLGYSVAQRFAKGGSVLEIEVPKGSNMAFIENVTQCQFEYEMILDKGSLFEITDVIEADKPIIKVRYLGHE